MKSPAQFRNARQDAARKRSSDASTWSAAATAPARSTSRPALLHRGGTGVPVAKTAIARCLRARRGGRAVVARRQIDISPTGRALRRRGGNGFMFAPSHIRHEDVGPTRVELATAPSSSVGRVHPAGVKRQMVGVFSRNGCSRCKVLKNLGANRSGSCTLRRPR